MPGAAVFDLRKLCPVSAETRPVSTIPTGLSMGLPSLSRITSSPTVSRITCKPIRRGADFLWLHFDFLVRLQVMETRGVDTGQIQFVRMHDMQHENFKLPMHEPAQGLERHRSEERRVGKE